MAEWTGRSNSKGHDLRIGVMRLSTTDQSERGCGWVWHVSVEHSYGNDGIAENGGCANEDEAKAAAIAWLRNHCEAALAALKEVA